MLTIRLSRIGKKKQANFRVIISEKAKDTQGNYLELLGYYNPHTNKLELKTERIKYWLTKGAQTSGTIHNLLVDQKIITAAKIKVANIKKKEKEEKTDTPPAPAAPKQEEKKAAPVVEKKVEPKAPVAEKKEETPAPAKEKTA